MGVLLSSSLVRCGFVFLTWPMPLNVRRKDMLGLHPYQALNGIMPFRAFVGAWLRMNTAVVTASPQNLVGMPLAFIMDLSHADHHLVPSLHHAILLWRVRRGVLAHHTLIRVVRSEVH